MKIILFGATGMIGQGVLRECLQAADVEAVLAVGRTELSFNHPKLVQWVRSDLFDYGIEAERFRDFDACFFCLGTSSTAGTEVEYTRLNYELPVAVGKAIAKVNPDLIFVYVSADGADSTQNGKIMWARVKGKTENALQNLGLRATYAFRPGIIIPLNGAVSKTRSYRLMYRLFGWVFALVRVWRPELILDTERMGLAMLQVARRGNITSIVEAESIHRLAVESELRW
ncbi:epimerase [Pseudomonas aeruginosa]|nr:epimerase [Pseudomonas aeruginosa]